MRDAIYLLSSLVINVINIFTGSLPIASFDQVTISEHLNELTAFELLSVEWLSVRAVVLKDAEQLILVFI